MKYQNYKAEDFAADEDFQNYFLFGKEKERGFWEKWIQQNSNKSAEIQEAKKLLNIISVDISEEEVKGALSDLKNNIIKDKPSREKLPRRSFFRFLPAAAAIFLGLVAAVFYFSNPHSPEWQVEKTDYSKHAQVLLPDGSSVLLNSNSSIKFDKNWTNRTIREVWLEGEGYFDVTKNPKKGKNQFIVHVGNGLIEILGTSFNAYHRNDFSEVALESGSINFRHSSKQHEQYLLKPGEAIRLTKNKFEQLGKVDLS